MRGIPEMKPSNYSSVSCLVNDLLTDYWFIAMFEWLLIFIPVYLLYSVKLCSCYSIIFDMIDRVLSQYWPGCFIIECDCPNVMYLQPYCAFFYKVWYLFVTFLEVTNSLNHPIFNLTLTDKSKNSHVFLFSSPTSLFNSPSSQRLLPFIWKENS